MSRLKTEVRYSHTHSDGDGPYQFNSHQARGGSPKKFRLAVNMSEALHEVFTVPIKNDPRALLIGRPSSLVSPNTATFEDLENEERQIDEYERNLRSSPQMTERRFRVGNQLYLHPNQQRRTLAVLVEVALDGVSGARQHIVKEPFFDGDSSDKLLVGHEFPFEILKALDDLATDLRLAQAAMANISHPSSTSGQASFEYGVDNLRVTSQ